MKPILRYKRKWSLFSKIVLFFFTILILALLIGYWNQRKNPVSEVEIEAVSLNEAVASPVCNTAAGFYNDELSVSLSTSIVGATIYYSTDGSAPGPDSKIYTSPIRIFKGKEAELSLIPTSPRWSRPVGDIFNGTVLRAIVVVNHMKSRELIRTFFVYGEKDKKYTLPVIALTIEADDLFGFKKGIYVMGKNYEQKKNYIKKKIPLNLPWWNYPSNYLKRGENAGRKANIEFFETSGSLGFDGTAGLRINGNATRGFSQKSLRIEFDEKYGNKQLNYLLFPGSTCSTYNTFLLSNSGNDWSKTMFRNALSQSLMKNMKIDIQAIRPCLLFINGEYWGIHQLSERFDTFYFANHYSIDPDQVSLLEVVNGSIEGNRKDVEAFEKIIRYAKQHDLKNDSCYFSIEKQIDMESFMDIIIANTFICNSDWPDNNVKFWKCKKRKGDSTGLSDERWRWILYDTDWGFGYLGPQTVHSNLFEKVRKSGTIGVIFDKLLQNEKFLKRFEQRFESYLKGPLQTDSLIGRIDTFQKLLAPEMEQHINRWRVIGSVDSWESNVEELRQFAKQRPGIQLKQLKQLGERYK